MTIGEKIRIARIERGFTQQHLGDLSGIAPPNIRKYETGRQSPKIVTIKKIASALGVDPLTLMSMDSSDGQGSEDLLVSLNPILHYIKTVGYTIEQEFEDIAGERLTGRIVLKAMTGESAVFTRKEIKEIADATRDAVDLRFYKKLMEKEK